MNERIRDDWAVALESDEYVQGRGGLRDSKGFCCLGVLCDLHRKEVTPEREWRGETYCGEFNHCPEEVLEWAGFTEDEVLEKDVGSYDVLFKDTEEDEYGDLQDVVYKASCLNDGVGSDDMSYPSESFDQIAVRVRAMEGL